MIDAHELGIFATVKAFIGHTLLPFCHLLANGIRIITVCLWCGIVGTIKRLWPYRLMLVSIESVNVGIN